MADEPRICSNCGDELAIHRTVPTDRGFEATFDTRWPCQRQGCRCKDFVE